ncbi:hypothetical protein GCM10009718_23260 [Isoptericola halotolerans]|uniref:CHAT domain-containing protein n=1 Tax=Isoptericola halotolerans TaxID=300560 RepID=A0ABX2A5H9_9MICO|nr:CHAT domain-containing protein [Isoptericola halotolerans]NOV98110.1 hypothetical protein [Isoptericola halotolerans]
MSRVVFQLSALGDQERRSTRPIVRLVEPVDDDAVDEEFDCPAVTARGADVNTQAGDRLYQALATHRSLLDHLGAARVSTDERFAVCAEILPRSGADTLPWETLRFPGDGPYLALEPKYALARVVRATAPPHPLYQLVPPLRVVALLSCLGLTAAGELARLRAVVQESDGMFELLVVLGEADLAAALQDDIDAGRAPGVAGVHLVPPDHHDLVELVNAFRPHVLHLFCHGSADSAPHVRLALKQDWSAAEPGIGLALQREQFAKFRWDADGGPWLVVLNCCEGAAPSREGLTSLARDLVSSGVAPAVIGMREPITGAVAHAVTQGLYGALRQELSSRTARATSTSTPLDWAALAVAARHRLVSEFNVARGSTLTTTQAQDQSREWTLPALYVRWEEFQLQVTTGTSEPGAERAWRLEVAALQSVLTSLPPGQGTAFRAAAVERVAELAELLGVTPEELAEEP